MNAKSIACGVALFAAGGAVGYALHDVKTKVESEKVYYPVRERRAKKKETAEVKQETEEKPEEEAKTEAPAEESVNGSRKDGTYIDPDEIADDIFDVPDIDEDSDRTESEAISNELEEDRKNGDDPYRISEYDFDNSNRHYDKNDEYYYYEFDDTLVDGDEQIVADERRDALGNFSELFDESGDGHDVICIRCPRRGADFKICRIHGYFER